MKVQREFLFAVAILVVSFCFFLAVRSNDYTAVDGPVRCLEVFHRNTLFFHSNNHLLYPAWILGWTRAAHFLGADLTGPFRFMRVSQAMNSFGAALCLAALYLILLEVSNSWFTPILGTMILAFSRAFMLHATNAAEVVTGLTCCLVAFAGVILALKSGKYLYLAACGFLFALALASYEAMALPVPLAGFLCIVWPVTGKNPQPSWKTALLRLTLLGSGVLIGIVGIYGFAYSSEGYSISQMPRQFFTLGGSPEVYGGFNLSKSLNVPFGLLRNLTGGLPSDYSGIRSLLRPSPRWLWISVAMTQFALCGTIFFLCFQTLAVGRGIWTGKRWKVFAAGFALCAAPIFFPLVFWGSLYDKLWLLPLTLLVVVAISALEARPPGRRAPQVLIILLITLVAIEGAINVPLTIEASRDATPYMDRAREVASVVGSGDAVMVGFDGVSVLYWAFFGNEVHGLVLPASNTASVTKWLDESCQRSRRETKNVYFLGVLDAPREQWDLFLGTHLRIPYDALELYRQRSMVIQTFPYLGSKLTLRAFVPD